MTFLLKEASFSNYSSFYQQSKHKEGVIMRGEIVERAKFVCPSCEASIRYFLHKLEGGLHIPGTPDWRKRLECVNCGADFADSLSHPRIDVRPRIG